MKTDIKNVLDARRILTPPLVFGNQEQIDAADFVALYEGALVCLTTENYSGGDCEECDGDGEAECECDCGDVHYSECKNCDGEGNVKATLKWLDALDAQGLRKVIEELLALGIGKAA